MTTTTAWISQAACAGQDTNDWFPVPEDDVRIETLRICATCPVSVECLERAVLGAEHGIWAGTTTRDRRALRRTRRLNGEHFPHQRPHLRAPNR